MKTKLSVSCVALAVFLFGCGGNSGLSPSPPSALDACHNPPACGGDIVGSWSIASTCLGVDLSSYTDGCPDSVAQANGYQITGMVTYDADMTFTLMSMLTGSVTVRYPTACLTPPDGAAVTCEQLGAALLAPGSYQAVQCLSNGMGCDCTIQSTPETVTRTGMYSISANNVLLAGTADESDYCVKGDGTAALGAHPASPVMGHVGLTSGSLTLTKQP